MGSHHDLWNRRPGLWQGQLQNAPAGGETFIDEDKTRAGWVAGAGVEHAFTDHLTAKLEYQYLNFGEYTVEGEGISTKATPDFHSIRIGLNYKF